MEISLYDSDQILNGPHMGPIEMPKLEAVNIKEARIDGKVLKHTVSEADKRTFEETNVPGSLEAVKNKEARIDKKLLKHTVSELYKRTFEEINSEQKPARLFKKKKYM